MIARDPGLELSGGAAASLTIDMDPADGEPGITRHRLKTGWRYRNPDGTPVTDPAMLDRIRALVIPPAWTDVWISLDEAGHLQATGRDARGRKQYLYHPAFRAERETLKFRRMKRFGKALPAIRARAQADLRRQGLSRERVLAAVVLLLDASLIRVGNRQYLKDNRSVGLTTMQRKHVSVEGKAIRFKFPGKSGKKHDITVKSGALANVVAACRGLRCPFVFAYPGEDGSPVCVTSQDVNAYLREVAGTKVSAKDFRTWSASAMALEVLAGSGQPTSAAKARREVNAALDLVAGRLGNTRSICRKSYVHPAILREYLSASKPLRTRSKGHLDGLTPAENQLLAFLRSKVANEC